MLGVILPGYKRTESLIAISDCDPRGRLGTEDRNFALNVLWNLRNAK